MEPELLHYEKIVESALRSVVRTALEQVATFGLPEGHSLYITFLTNGPGVNIPQRLMDTYPEEMTIVLEHQFWNLTIDDAWFSVELSFNRRQERLEVPFACVTSFADPSVPFGLKFELTAPADDARDGATGTGTTGSGSTGTASTGTGSTGTGSTGTGLSESVLDTGETAPAANSDSDAPEKDDAIKAEDDGDAEDPPMGEVVNLDAFRKNR